MQSFILVSVFFPLCCPTPSSSSSSWVISCFLFSLSQHSLKCLLLTFFFSFVLFWSNPSFFMTPCHSAHHYWQHNYHYFLIVFSIQMPLLVTLWSIQKSVYSIWFFCLSFLLLFLISHPIASLPSSILPPAAVLHAPHYNRRCHQRHGRDASCHCTGV